MQRPNLLAMYVGLAIEPAWAMHWPRAICYRTYDFLRQAFKKGSPNRPPLLSEAVAYKADKQSEAYQLLCEWAAGVNHATP